MKWLKNLLGIKTKQEKLLAELAKLQELAFKAQRKGDMELAGEYRLKAEQIIENNFTTKTSEQSNDTRQ